MKFLYPLLVRVNKLLFPSWWKKDLSKLSPLEKLIVAYKIWLGKKAAA